jgi:hypothetical protein
MIVNQSLSSGCFPTSLKHAIVTPLLKKPKLDADELANYRPISNLSYLGKLIERVAISQIQAFLQSNDLVSPAQSAYRPHYSVETALLRTQNDLLQALDSGKEAILVLLDFSSAFDLIDHDLLCHRLQTRYGISGSVLAWIKSYLAGRTQSIAVKNVLSDDTPLTCGVPQGSVAGPLLFTLYSEPLQDLIASHGIQAMVYADDTQLYLCFDPADRSRAIAAMERCIADVKTWATNNKLALNDAKTELIHMTSKFSRNVSLPLSLVVGDSTIHASSSARNLGVVVDSKLTMKNHIDTICKSAMTAIRRIGQIREYLDEDTTARLVHSFVSSRLDSCNSLLYGLPDCHINRLQRIQNIAARLVARIPRSHHITPILRSLHWLPVKQRTVYKILLLAYKTQHNLAPQYLMDLISSYKPQRTLRSSSQGLLVMPFRPKTIFYGDRSFAYAAPTLWNQLPQHVRRAESVLTFKRLLKTVLFDM